MQQQVSVGNWPRAEPGRLGEAKQNGPSGLLDGNPCRKALALPEAYVPTLVVTGTTSPAAALLVAEGLARAAPRASTVTVTGAGHMLPITHAPDLIQILRSRFEVGASSSLKAA